MVPKHLHVADFIFDSVDLLVAVIDQLGISKFIGGVAKVRNFDVHFVDFSVYCVKLSEGILTSALVFVEIALFKILGVDFKVFLKFSNLVIVLLSFTLHEGENLLVSFLCYFLKINPVFKKFFGLLNLRIFG